MALPKTVTMTRAGGNFWRAQAFSLSVSYLILLPPVLVGLILAIANPFWFRESFFSWVERQVNNVTRWRNRVTYRIYLDETSRFEGLKAVGSSPALRARPEAESPYSAASVE
jgi:hypothetical protein